MITIFDSKHKSVLPSVATGLAACSLRVISFCFYSLYLREIRMRHDDTDITVVSLLTFISRRPKTAVVALLGNMFIIKIQYTI